MTIDEQLQQIRDHLRAIDSRQAALARAAANQSLQLERVLPRLADDLGHIHGALLLIDATTSRIERAQPAATNGRSTTLLSVDDGHVTARFPRAAALATWRRLAPVALAILSTFAGWLARHLLGQ